MSKAKKIEVESLVVPADNLQVTEYADYLNDVKGKARFFDRNLGWTSWVQGKVLLLARDACKREKKQWSDFLRTIGMNKATAYHLRRIADAIPHNRAMDLSYSEMLAKVYPSYRQEIKDGVETEDGQKVETKGGRKSKKGDVTFLRLTTDLSGVKSVVQNLAVDFRDIDLPDDCRDGKKMTETLDDLSKVETELQTIRGKVTAWQTEMSQTPSQTPSLPALKVA